METVTKPGSRPEPETAGEMLRLGREFLERKGLSEARLESELLVAHALGIDRLKLFLSLERPLEVAEVGRARELLVRRSKREPVAYITGAREFYSRPFRVGPGVLVPRPETELLVDLARDRVREAGQGTREPLRIADLGTGSGCLAITLALELPGARVTAVDVSPVCIELARENAAALGAEIELLEGDGLELLAEAARRERFDVLVCNPPYVTPEEREGLEPDVALHEPELALFAPPGDPDHWLRRLLDASRELLAPGGQLLVELGAGQAQRARALAAERGQEVRLHRDLAGIERVLEYREEPLSEA